MINKSIFLVSVISIFFLFSCKKEGAVSKIDAGVEAVPKTVQTDTNSQAEPAANSAVSSNIKSPVMTFETTEHDFGAINGTDKVAFTFIFKNTGSSDLLISNAVGSCGCTVPEYQKEPIPAGKSGKIRVIFNPSGKSGQQQKTVTITTNTANGQELLTIKAAITSKPGSHSGIISN